MPLTDFLFSFKLGWSHLTSLAALDHLLFVLALVIVYTTKDIKPVITLLLAFTLGYTLTLLLSTMDLLRFPQRWVAFLVPCTIITIAFVNLFRKKFVAKSMQSNYYLALLFGLIHGMVFANTFQTILAKDKSLAWSLVGFNLGLEVGLIAFMVTVLMVTWCCLSLLRVKRREWVLFISAAAFSLALQMAITRLPF